MKVFLSWSGQTSKALAAALRDWLPPVIQNVEPWMSDIDVQAGARWGRELGEQLEGTTVGIICLTPENLGAPWLQFEAGALSKTLDNSRVIPYLFNLAPNSVKGPLAEFQAVRADKTGTKKLVQTLDRARADETKSLTDAQLDRIFERWWPDLEQALRQIQAEFGHPVPAESGESDRPRPAAVSPLESISREAANEMAYTFYYLVFGLAYENLVILGTLHEDGSMTVRRESKLVAYSNGIGAVDQYLLCDAQDGSIDVAAIELLSPAFHKLSKRTQRATADSLTLVIDISPPLNEGENIEFVVVEKTPPGAITTSYEAMLARGKPYPYECLYWDITRPTKHLEMKVQVPAGLAPRDAKPDVWFGPSRITCEQELHRISGSFRRGPAVGAQEELVLDVMYPVAGLRYAIKWIPKAG